MRGERAASIFRHAPSSLAQLYPLAQRARGPKELTVMEGARLTYGEVFAQAALLAAQLSARAASSRGTHVAIAMRNRPGVARGVHRD